MEEFWELRKEAMNDWTFGRQQGAGSCRNQSEKNLVKLYFSFSKFVRTGPQFCLGLMGEGEVTVIYLERSTCKHPLM